MTDTAMSKNRALEIARAVGARFAADDQAAKTLGVVYEEVRPGYARLALTVEKHMTNGHEICHGGVIFTLADTAFACACNSYNRAAVAVGCAIEFLAPGRIGDRLTATVREQALAGRAGVYDVTVTNQNNQTIALFRGKSRRIEGRVIAELEEIK
jgi:acyl-CoA thioesterase